MVLVESADLRPGLCMFLKSATGPFIDLLRDFDFDHDGRMYVSVQYAKELGRAAGLIDAEAAEAVRVELEGARARILELEDELLATDAVIDAIDVIESRDFRARRKPGRPKRRNEDDDGA